MDAPEPSPHRRRLRYRGTHPRRFGEKYKELDPARDPATVAKVFASGKTPAGMHVPIMVGEILAFLQPAPGQAGLDATLGYGGHAENLLARLAPGGRLIGLDVDPVQLPRTVERLRSLGYEEPAFRAIRSNFAGLSKVLAETGPFDFLLADLGCSSMQIDDPGRGFTFKAAGPLDMRMNPERGLSAREWLSRAKAETLTTVLRENSDESHAGELAIRLAGKDFPDTLALARAIRAALPGQSEEAIESSIRRVFQAIRIAVNDEFGALDAFLRVLPQAIKPGGRVAILTFHSGEDRRVKLALREGRRLGQWENGNEDVITAGPEERRANPRSQPAKLRVAIRARE
ncbi:MAG: 16S rRNA (cytosine(1402)-N(4))-methyltransferase RsmH [Verrucomicrobiales bacterium]